MSRLRSDYEKTKWRRFERWVNGEESESIQSKETFKNTEETEHLDGTALESSFALEADTKEMIFPEDVYNERRKQEIAELYKKYKKWPQTKGVKIFTRIYQFLSVLICCSIIILLLMTVSYLPKFGNPNNPNNNEVPKRYIENGLQETGAVNIVTGMILDYRAFDTLGESHVLFIAVCCVMILLRIEHDKNGKATVKSLESEEFDRNYEPKNDKILQKIAFLLVPPIIIFGIYVILNGHLSPGGGFSGGAIIGAGLILYLNAYGFQKTERFFTYKTFSTISIAALLVYACAKSYSFFTGANHIKSIIPLGTPGAILSSGLILVLNICVGLVVSCTMYGFYALFRKGGI